MTESAPVKAVDLALKTIARYDRADLTARLKQARVRLVDDHIRILVVGEFKQGKSLLINGLVTAPVCPVYDDVATSVPTVVRYGDTPSATVVRIIEAGGEDGATESRTDRIAVPVEDLPNYVSEAGNPGNREQLSFAEVAVPRRILSNGLEVVDTPGVGGLHSVHGAATMSVLPTADAVLLVSDASQEYTEPELEFLRQAVKVCPNVACVLTKSDLYPEWRRIAELDRKHLATAGIDAEMFTVSSTLRLHAAKADDTELNEESGFPALVRYIRQRVVGQADLLARRSTVHDIVAVTDQLAVSLRAEQSAQQNPEHVESLIRQLTAAEQRAAALKERSARWQVTLNDGVADVNADIDYDLRDRMREIMRLGEEEINNGGDPTKTWSQFTGWVEQEVSTAASATFIWATQRTRFLARQVADHFSEDAAQIAPALRTEATDALSAVRGMAIREGEPWGAGQKALTALRGGYVGVLMFGLLGTLVGLSLLNPFSIGAGLVLGGKAITDERRRIVTRRQNDARMALRRYVDDVIFQVGKDSRDILRGAQRELRDHFTAQADQMMRTIAESLQAAERSVKTSKGDRQRRLIEIKAELEKLENLQQRVRTLLPQPTPAQATTAPSEKLLAVTGR